MSEAMQTRSKQDLAHQGEVVVNRFLSGTFAALLKPWERHPVCDPCLRCTLPDFDFLRDRLWLLGLLGRTGTSSPGKRDPLRLPSPESRAREEHSGPFWRCPRARRPGVRCAGTSLFPRAERALQKAGRPWESPLFRTPGGAAPVPLFVGLMLGPVQMMTDCRTEFLAFALFVQRLSIAEC